MNGRTTQNVHFRCKSLFMYHLIISKFTKWDRYLIINYWEFLKLSYIYTPYSLRFTVRSFGCVLGRVLYWNPPLQLSIQCSPQRTSKWLNSKPHWATRQQAIAKTPAKWYVYQIPSVIVVFVILVFKVYFVKFLFPKATRGFEPISYRGALLSTLLHNLLNVLVQIANKMGF
jgi:hypothetical protein